MMKDLNQQNNVLHNDECPSLELYHTLSPSIAYQKLPRPELKIDEQSI